MFAALVEGAQATSLAEVTHEVFSSLTELLVDATCDYFSIGCTMTKCAADLARTEAVVAKLTIWAIFICAAIFAVLVLIFVSAALSEYEPSDDVVKNELGRPLLVVCTTMISALVLNAFYRINSYLSAASATSAASCASKLAMAVAQEHELRDAIFSFEWIYFVAFTCILALIGKFFVWDHGLEVYMQVKYGIPVPWTRRTRNDYFATNMNEEEEYRQQKQHQQQVQEEVPRGASIEPTEAEKLLNEDEGWYWDDKTRTWTNRSPEERMNFCDLLDQHNIKNKKDWYRWNLVHHPDKQRYEEGLEGIEMKRAKYRCDRLYKAVRAAWEYKSKWRETV